MEGLGIHGGTGKSRKLLLADSDAQCHSDCPAVAMRLVLRDE